MISVCIPLYNSPIEYISRLLESLEEQTFKDFKVLIQDDTSSIDYAHVIEKHKPSLTISYVRNEKNLGMVGNWNKNLSRVDSEYFILLGHDDYLASDAFEKLLTPMLEDKEIICSSCGCNYINERGAPLEKKFNVNHRDKIFKKHTSYIKSSVDAVSLCLKNGIAFGELSCQLFRSKQFPAQYSPEFRHAADLDFFLLNISMSPSIKVSYNTEKLVYRRIHSSALTEKNYLNGYVSEEREKIFVKYARSLPGLESKVSSFRAYIVACAFYDILKIPHHRSATVTKIALRQITSNIGLNFFDYFRLMKSIITDKNMDEQ